MCGGVGGDEWFGWYGCIGMGLVECIIGLYCVMLSCVFVDWCVYLVFEVEIVELYEWVGLCV